MSESRQQMNLVLKEHVIPEIRNKGFKGSLPHFRRLRDHQTDLITFQFSQWGGGFVIEAAIGPAEPFDTHWGKRIEPNKMTAHDIGDRIRLGPKEDEECDFWFIYEGQGEKPMEELASLALEHINGEAERYWNPNHNKTRDQIADTKGAID